MSDFRTVFFDFDGTIADTEPDIRGAWQNAIASLNLQCDHFDTTFRVGPSLPETALMLFPEVSNEFRNLIMQAYKNFYDEADDYSACPYPGMIEAFKELAYSGKRIYVVTNKRLKPTSKLLKKFDLLDCCAGMFTPDIISPEYLLSKPDLVGLAFRQSCTPLPSQVLMVGDTEIDILSGKQHALSTCGVTWGYGRPGKLGNANPDFIVHTADELLKLF